MYQDISWISNLIMIFNCFCCKSVDCLSWKRISVQRMSEFIFSLFLLLLKLDSLSFISRYLYKLAREYNWNVKNKAIKGFEVHRLIIPPEKSM